MGESKKHNSLVIAIEKWIEKNKGGGDNTCLLTDSGLSSSKSRPKPINGHVPDIYAENLTKERWIIIGEAKTARDLESKRSEKQIKEFLKYCASYPGTLFILSVPWDTTIYARSLLKIFKKELGFPDLTTLVINELGFSGE
ncbi:hypothetical protein [uncultured Desulfosarcina sp.]|uniref:hypothetical protein n=1 Tax=uncultured Desulfosarcina sp. TaxID=218289 RepID=UPI0029C8CFCA|nr:hypothetical protein [uncultured Desulfosarcina sp.]